MKLKENIAVSESGFIFDPNTGESFSVNSTGKQILQMVSKGLSMKEIESSIMADYEVDEKTFLRYMDDFAHTLRRLNLIETETDE
ncbi:MAG: PqqD family protein [Bacteroidales bacterium]